MLAHDQLEAGQLDAALATLTDAVRRKPRDAEARASLFRLYCVLGEWDYAASQVELLAKFNEQEARLKPTWLGLIQCEQHRSKVFAGHTRPTVLGKPDEWLGCLISAGEALAKGDTDAAARLREQAGAGAPSICGSINGAAFTSLVDSDTRLGPVLEAFVGGGYRWVPLTRVRRVTTEAPADLLDLVWVFADFTWSTGQTARGVIPARYYGSERSDDADIRLARRTEWTELGGGFHAGLGQRIFFTGTEGVEFPLLEMRTLEIQPNQPN